MLAEDEWASSEVGESVEEVWERAVKSRPSLCRVLGGFADMQWEHVGPLHLDVESRHVDMKRSASMTGNIARPSGRTPGTPEVCIDFPPPPPPPPLPLLTGLINRFQRSFTRCTNYIHYTPLDHFCLTLTYVHLPIRRAEDRSSRLPIPLTPCRVSLKPFLSEPAILPLYVSAQWSDPRLISRSCARTRHCQPSNGLSKSVDLSTSALRALLAVHDPSNCPPEGIT